MPKWRVLMTDRAWPDTTIERQILQTIDAELIEPPSQEEAALVQVVGQVDAIATNWAKVTPAVVAAATRCQVISRLGIGVDNIAIPEATARNIPVTNCPDYCIPEVADHTLALILALTRRIAFLHAETKQGRYSLADVQDMRRLSTQTLGLFGLGRTGREVATRARAFGLQVIAHTASGSDHGTGCEMVSFDELLTRSNILSLHAPLTPDTRRRFSTVEFHKLPRGACLINTSRGGLVDEAALWQALQDQHLSGAAMDVFDPEPPDLSKPLFRDPRVIVTPHAAFVSVESLQGLRTRVMRQIVAVLSGQRPENVLNPSVYA
ncbi:C-terminal binding protein [bacterium]|nr:C-terminal binding protein [bacterium]